jgi:hypothetical protein
MDEGFGLWDLVQWALAGLLGLVVTLSAFIWKGQEKATADLKKEHSERMDGMDMRHTQHAHDLTQHAVGDAASHEVIKRDLASAIDRLNDKIDDKTAALSTQITTQHGQILDVLKLIQGGRS